MLASLAAKGLRVISREEAAARQKEIGAVQYSMSPTYPYPYPPFDNWCIIRINVLTMLLLNNNSGM
jgi:hypothetical protein